MAPALCEQLMQHVVTGEVKPHITVIGVGEEQLVGPYAIVGIEEGFSIQKKPDGPLKVIAYDDTDEADGMDNERRIQTPSGIVYIRAIPKR